MPLPIGGEGDIRASGVRPRKGPFRLSVTNQPNLRMRIVRGHDKAYPMEREWGNMPIDPNAGKPAQPSMLVNVPRLVTAYYACRPDPAVRAQRVAFGTSGHRGTSFALSFNEAHILAITQA